MSIIGVSSLTPRSLPSPRAPSSRARASRRLGTQRCPISLHYLCGRPHGTLQNALGRCHRESACYRGGRPGRSGNHPIVDGVVAVARHRGRRPEPPLGGPLLDVPPAPRSDGERSSGAISFTICVSMATQREGGVSTRGVSVGPV